MGIVDERPRSLTAVAIDNVSLTSVTRDEFVDFLFQNPKEGIKYIQALFERLRAMNTRILPEDNTYLLDIEPPKKDKIIFLPLTKESSNSVPSGGIPIYKFPFRVGRISMRDEPNPLDLNDLYLTDSIPFNVSRNHFSIEHINNNFVIRERGSYHGTVVNGDQIGGSIVMNDAQLKHGENEIIVGSINSPFRFRIVVQS